MNIFNLFLNSTQLNYLVAPGDVCSLQNKLSIPSGVFYDSPSHFLLNSSGYFPLINMLWLFQGAISVKIHDSKYFLSTSI